MVEFIAFQSFIANRSLWISAGHLVIQNTAFEPDCLIPPKRLLYFSEAFHPLADIRPCP